MDLVFSVFGLGRAGLPIAAYIASKGFKVFGIDVNKSIVDKVNSGVNPFPDEPGLSELVSRYGGDRLVASTSYKDASEANVYIIIVPLGLDEDNNPDFRFLEAATRDVGKVLKKGDLVVVETTVPPLTTENLVRSWLEEESGLVLGDFYLAHSPERIITGRVFEVLETYPKVVGGVDEASGEYAYRVYKMFIGDVHLVSSARVAEFTKLMEGIYRDVNIALANLFYMMTRELGIDFYEARTHANHHKHTHILLPSTGVGGHCIPVYPWFVIKEFMSRGREDLVRLLLESREINDGMVDYWARRILEVVGNGDDNDVKVCVKGLAFKPGVAILSGSRNVELVKRLLEMGLDVYVYDENLVPSDVEGLGFKWLDPSEADVVFDAFSLKIIDNRVRGSLGS